MHIQLSELVKEEISYHANSIAKYGAMNEIAKIADLYKEAFPVRHNWSELTPPVQA
jgi:hypothetical protein